MGKINAHFSLSNEQAYRSFRMVTVCVECEWHAANVLRIMKIVISHSRITQIFHHRQQRHTIFCSCCGILDALFDDSLRSGTSYYMIRIWFMWVVHLVIRYDECAFNFTKLFLCPSSVAYALSPLLCAMFDICLNSGLNVHHTIIVNH